MLDPLQIGQFINARLTSDDQIRAFLGRDVSRRVLPIVAPRDMSGCFITYQRTETTPEASKDNRYGDLYESMILRIVSDSENYKGGLELAVMVKQALKDYEGVFDGLQIDNIKVSDGEEGYSDNCFYQELQLLITINNE